MNINVAFPSDYLKADDLQGRRALVLISHVEMEDIGSEGKKPVLHFQGKDRGLILNKTNAAMLTEICGTPETDMWRGVGVVLYPTKVDYQGKRVPAIRIDYPQQEQGAMQARPQAAPLPPQLPTGGELEVDSIPFMWVVPFVLPALLAAHAVLA